MHILYLGGTFDCANAAKNLREKSAELRNLPYNEMRAHLYAKGVITRNDKERLDKMINTEQMSYLIDILTNSLDLKMPKKYKKFLESMEESDDLVLNKVAQNLG